MIPDTALPPIPGTEERPPHVEFELRPVEDREASMQAGQKIMRDQEYSLIFPRGGKDKVRKAVPQPPEEGRMPSLEYQEFMARFGKQYQAWKAGLEIPVEGTDLRQFRLLTPAQIENCRTYHIYTVEQLAEASEEAITNIGMGSRNLKMTAQRWLEFGDKGGKSVSRIEELEAKNHDLEELNKQLTAKVEELQVNVNEPRKPGRPKKDS
jgi:hypothetical protein